MTPDTPANTGEEQAYKIEVQSRLIVNAYLGENCDTQSFFKDTLEAKRIGLTEDERFQNFLHKAGEDPILREGLYLNLRKDLKAYHDASSPPEKELEFQSIQNDLQLAAILGMDQKPQIENYQPFYEFIVQTKAEYGLKPAETKTDEEEAREFYNQLDQTNKLTDDQQIANNLQKMKGLAGFREIDQAIQNLSLDLSREAYTFSTQAGLILKGISEKLTEELENTGGWDKGEHQNNIAAVALALNQPAAPAPQAPSTPDTGDEDFN